MYLNDFKRKTIKKKKPREVETGEGSKLGSRFSRVTAFMWASALNGFEKKKSIYKIVLMISINIISGRSWRRIWEDGMTPFIFINTFYIPYLNCLKNSMTPYTILWSDNNTNTGTWLDLTFEEQLHNVTNIEIAYF